MRPRDVTSYLRSLAQTWRCRGVLQLHIGYNRRLTSTVARVLAHERVIELNPAVADLSARGRREVICHEAAHLVVWQRHGQDARPHGPEWAALVRLAGFQPRAARLRCG